MSTHAAIIVKTKDGIYQACYLHHDGYPAHAAAVLTSDFNSQELAQKLASQGMVEDIKLGGFITEWEDQKDVGQTFAATIEEIVTKMSVFHVYVFEKGAWTYDQVPLVAGFRRDPKWTFRGRNAKDAALHDANVRYHNTRHAGS